MRVEPLAVEVRDYIDWLAREQSGAVVQIRVDLGRVVERLAEIWPTYEAWSAQAFDLWTLMDSVVQAAPRSAMVCEAWLRICISDSNLGPKILPSPEDCIAVAVFDAAQGVMRECVFQGLNIDPDDAERVMGDMTAAAGLMLECEMISPLISSHVDTIPVVPPDLDTKEAVFFSERSRAKILIGPQPIEQRELIHWPKIPYGITETATQQLRRPYQPDFINNSTGLVLQAQDDVRRSGKSGLGTTIQGKSILFGVAGAVMIGGYLQYEDDGGGSGPPMAHKATGLVEGHPVSEAIVAREILEQSKIEEPSRIEKTETQPELSGRPETEISERSTPEIIVGREAGQERVLETTPFAERTSGVNGGVPVLAAAVIQNAVPRQPVATAVISAPAQVAAPQSPASTEDLTVLARETASNEHDITAPHHRHEVRDLTDAVSGHVPEAPHRPHEVEQAESGLNRRAIEQFVEREAVMVEGLAVTEVAVAGALLTPNPASPQPVSEVEDRSEELHDALVIAKREEAAKAAVTDAAPQPSPANFPELTPQE